MRLQTERTCCVRQCTLHRRPAQRGKESTKTYWEQTQFITRTVHIHDLPDASPTASSHPQVCQRELCHGLCPSPVNSSAWKAPSARTIPPALDRLHLVIDDTI